MPGNIDAQQLLDKLSEYHAEIVALARETTNSVSSLEDARKIVEASKTTFWKVYKTQITLVIAVALVIILAIAMKATDICTVGLSTEKIVDIQSCKAKP
jgi:hypothetical protein